MLVECIKRNRYDWQLWMNVSTSVCSRETTTTTNAKRSKKVTFNEIMKCFYHLLMIDEANLKVGVQNNLLTLLKRFTTNEPKKKTHTHIDRDLFLSCLLKRRHFYMGDLDLNSKNLWWLPSSKYITNNERLKFVTNECSLNRLVRIIETKQNRLL